MSFWARTLEQNLPVDNKDAKNSKKEAPRLAPPPTTSFTSSPVPAGRPHPLLSPKKPAVTPPISPKLHVFNPVEKKETSSSTKTEGESHAAETETPAPPLYHYDQTQDAPSLTSEQGDDWGDDGDLDDMLSDDAQHVETARQTLPQVPQAADTGDDDKWGDEDELDELLDTNHSEAESESKHVESTPVDVGGAWVDDNNLDDLLESNHLDENELRDDAVGPPLAPPEEAVEPSNDEVNNWDDANELDEILDDDEQGFRIESADTKGDDWGDTNEKLDDDQHDQAGDKEALVEASSNQQDNWGDTDELDADRYDHVEGQPAMLDDNENAVDKERETLGITKELDKPEEEESSGKPEEEETSGKPEEEESSEPSLASDVGDTWGDDDGLDEIFDDAAEESDGAISPPHKQGDPRSSPTVGAPPTSPSQWTSSPVPLGRPHPLLSPKKTSLTPPVSPMPHVFNPASAKQDTTESLKHPVVGAGQTQKNEPPRPPVFDDYDAATDSEEEKEPSEPNPSDETDQRHDDVDLDLMLDDTIQDGSEASKDPEEPFDDAEQAEPPSGADVVDSPPQLDHPSSPRQVGPPPTSPSQWKGSPVPPGRPHPLLSPLKTTLTPPISPAPHVFNPASAAVSEEEHVEDEQVETPVVEAGETKDEQLSEPPRPPVFGDYDTGGAGEDEEKSEETSQGEKNSEEASDEQSRESEEADNWGDEADLDVMLDDAKVNRSEETKDPEEPFDDTEQAELPTADDAVDSPSEMHGDDPPSLGQGGPPPTSPTQWTSSPVPSGRPHPLLSPHHKTTSTPPISPVPHVFNPGSSAVSEEEHEKDAQVESTVVEAGQTEDEQQSEPPHPPVFDDYDTTGAGEDEEKSEKISKVEMNSEEESDEQSRESEEADNWGDEADLDVMLDDAKVNRSEETIDPEEQIDDTEQTELPAADSPPERHRDHSPPPGQIGPPPTSPTHWTSSPVPPGRPHPLLSPQKTTTTPPLTSLPHVFVPDIKKTETTSNEQEAEEDAVPRPPVFDDYDDAHLSEEEKEPVGISDETQKADEANIDEESKERTYASDHDDYCGDEADLDVMDGTENSDLEKERDPEEPLEEIEYPTAGPDRVEVESPASPRPVGPPPTSPGKWTGSPVPTGRPHPLLSPSKTAITPTVPPMPHIFNPAAKSSTGVTDDMADNSDRIESLSYPLIGAAQTAGVAQMPAMPLYSQVDVVEDKDASVDIFKQQKKPDHEKDSDGQPHVSDIGGDNSGNTEELDEMLDAAPTEHPEQTEEQVTTLQSEEVPREFFLTPVQGAKEETAVEGESPSKVESSIDESGYYSVEWTSPLEEEDEKMRRAPGGKDPAKVSCWGGVASEKSSRQLKTGASLAEDPSPITHAACSVLEPETLADVQDIPEVDEGEGVPPLPPGWIQLFDESSGDPYYLNEAENVTTWERPVAENDTNVLGVERFDPQDDQFQTPVPVEQEVDERVASANEEPLDELKDFHDTLWDGWNAQQSDQAAFLEPRQTGGETNSSDEGGKRPLPLGWEELVDPSSGEKYYFNEVDDVTTWDRPVAEPDRDPQSDEDLGPAIAKLGLTLEEDIASRHVTDAAGEEGWKEQEEDLNERIGENVVGDRPGKSESENSPQLPSGWIQLFDETSGDVYYLNEVENVTTWDRPMGICDAATDDVEGSGSADSGNSLSGNSEADIVSPARSEEDAGKTRDHNDGGPSDDEAEDDALAEDGRTRVDADSRAPVDNGNGIGPQNTEEIASFELSARPVAETLGHGSSDAEERSVEKQEVRDAEISGEWGDFGDAEEDSYAAESAEDGDDDIAKGSGKVAADESMPMPPGNEANSVTKWERPVFEGETMMSREDRPIAGGRQNESLQAGEKEIEGAEGATEVPDDGGWSDFETEEDDALLEAVDNAEDGTASPIAGGGNGRTAGSMEVDDAAEASPVPGWAQIIDPSSGNQYYYNESENLMTWEKPSPDGDSEAELLQDPSTLQAQDEKHIEGQEVSLEPVVDDVVDGGWGEFEDDFEDLHADNVQKSSESDNDKAEEGQDSVLPADESPPLLPHGWIQLIDEASGNVYYLNEIDNTTTWDRPFDANHAAGGALHDGQSDESPLVQEVVHVAGTDRGDLLEFEEQEAVEEEVQEVSAEVGASNNFEGPDNGQPAKSKSTPRIAVSDDAEESGDDRSSITPDGGPLPSLFRGWMERIIPASAYDDSSDEFSTDGSADEVSEETGSAGAADNAAEDVAGWSDFEEEAEDKSAQKSVGAQSIEPKVPGEPGSTKEETLTDHQMLPPGWVQLLDTASGNPYYFNETDNITTWQKPSADSKAQDLSPNDFPEDEPEEPAAPEDAGEGSPNDFLGEEPEEPAAPEDAGEGGWSDIEGDDEDGIEHVEADGSLDRVGGFEHDNVVDTEEGAPLQEESPAEEEVPFQDETRAQLPRGWAHIIARSSGNEADNSFTREMPAAGAADNATDDGIWSDFEEQAEDKFAQENVGSQSTEPQGLAEPGDVEEETLTELQMLPPGWVQLLDTASGNPYYFNETDNITTWEKPLADSKAQDLSQNVLSEEEPEEPAAPEDAGEGGWSDVEGDDEDGIEPVEADVALDHVGGYEHDNFVEVEQVLQEESPAEEEVPLEEETPAKLPHGWTQIIALTSGIKADISATREIPAALSETEVVAEETIGESDTEHPSSATAADADEGGGSDVGNHEEIASPQGKEDFEQGADEDAETAALDEYSVEAGEPPSQLPRGWVQMVDPYSGNPYYFNESTKLTRWERPEAEGDDDQGDDGEKLPESPDKPVVGNDEIGEQDANSGGWSDFDDFDVDSPVEAKALPGEELGEEQPAHAEEMATSAIEDSTLPLATGWKELFDPTSGRPYYLNEADNTTTWERPPLVEAKRPSEKTAAVDDAEVSSDDKPILKEQAAAIAEKTGDNEAAAVTDEDGWSDFEEFDEVSKHTTESAGDEVVSATQGSEASKSAKNEETAASSQSEEQVNPSSEAATLAKDLVFTDDEPVLAPRELPPLSLDEFEISAAARAVDPGSPYSPRFEFLSGVPSELQKLQEQSARRRHEFHCQIHDLECRLASFTAKLAHNTMDMDLVSTDWMDRLVAQPLEGVAERVFVEADKKLSPRPPPSASGPCVADIERRMMKLDTSMMRHVHVTLHDAKSKWLESLYPVVQHELTPFIRMETSKAAKRETTVFRRFESTAGTMSRQYQETQAGRRVALEMMQLNLNDAATESDEEEKGEEFLKTIQELRQKLQQERLQRKKQDRAVLNRIVETTAAMKRALLETVGDPTG